MPHRLAHPCNHRGCGALTHSRYCPTHQTEHSRAYEQTRPRPSERGYNELWAAVRKRALERDHYLCQECLKYGRKVAAQHVHHIKDTATHPDLFYVLSNLQSLCKPCHSQVTLIERHKSLTG